MLVHKTFSQRHSPHSKHQHTKGHRVKSICAKPNVILPSTSIVSTFTTTSVATSSTSASTSASTSTLTSATATPMIKRKPLLPKKVVNIRLDPFHVQPFWAQPIHPHHQLLYTHKQQSQQQHHYYHSSPRSPSLSLTTPYSFTQRPFHQTSPTHFIGRLLFVTGVISIGLGARYISRGGSAFVSAFRNAKDNLKPIDQEEINVAASEIADAAREVVDKSNEEQQERDAAQEKLRKKEYEKENPATTGTAPKYYNDDMSMHVDQAAMARKKRANEAAAQHKEHYESNEEEIAMNELIEKWEIVMSGDCSGFADEMTLLEAESILQTSSNPCIEELKDRRATMMRLNHPDLGGSPFLAGKVNEAYEKLIVTAKSDPQWLVQKQAKKMEDMARRLEILKQFEMERLKKEGKLDQDGDIPHPDGLKRYDSVDQNKR